ncbi:hypothetical protein K438DRAFT_1782158 [Mycena galopus ATCC 62051]|nr:hypothetical protein K438DRAFT_1782158 [Mycena galopus ATCC 62051]
MVAGIVGPLGSRFGRDSDSAAPRNEDAFHHVNIPEMGSDELAAAGSPIDELGIGGRLTIAEDTDSNPKKEGEDRGCWGGSVVLVLGVDFKPRPDGNVGLGAGAWICMMLTPKVLASLSQNAVEGENARHTTRATTCVSRLLERTKTDWIVQRCRAPRALASGSAALLRICHVRVPRAASVSERQCGASQSLNLLFVGKFGIRCVEASLWRRHGYLFLF